MLPSASGSHFATTATQPDPLPSFPEPTYRLLTDRRQNLMKGYIARERGIVVLSKAGAFPGTGA